MGKITCEPDSWKYDKILSLNRTKGLYTEWFLSFLSLWFTWWCWECLPWQEGNSFWWFRLPSVSASWRGGRWKGWSPSWTRLSSQWLPETRVTFSSDWLFIFSASWSRSKTLSCDSVKFWKNPQLWQRQILEMAERDYASKDLILSRFDFGWDLRCNEDSGSKERNQIT